MALNKKRALVAVVLPVIVLLVAVGAAVTMVATKPDVVTEPPPFAPPLVRVVEVELDDREMIVRSQGTVNPRTESRVVPEVSGRVIWVSDSFASGGFFEEGEALVRVDPFDYEQAVVAARSELARTELRLAQEQAEARVARTEWEELGRGDGNALALREPQLADARAAVAGARANVERAERNLSRTELRAPYAGRIREESVDVGQFVSSTTPVATIYAVDAAEVRLPLPDDELAFVDLPMTYRGGKGNGPRPSVTLSTAFAGERHVWEGTIVRTEGEIDPATRMVHAVARVEDPYAPGDNPRRPPLKAGMFVQAEIRGRLVERVAVLPRTALRADSRIWVVDGESRLRIREVRVLRATETEIVVTEGLSNGDVVVLSALDAITDGMAVRIAEGEGESR